MTDLFDKPPDNASFLADLAENISTDEMRKRYKAGHYGKLRTDYVQSWIKLAGRR